MDCLDETTAARLLDRSLSGAETEQIARHIDSCEDCRAFVSALARSQATDSMTRGARETLELTSFAAGFAPAAGPMHALDVSLEPPSQVGLPANSNAKLRASIASWRDRHRR